MNTPNVITRVTIKYCGEGRYFFFLSPYCPVSASTADNFSVRFNVLLTDRSKMPSVNATPAKAINISGNPLSDAPYNSCICVDILPFTRSAKSSPKAAPNPDSAKNFR